ncbi:hypothetical protein FRC03_000863 [Tulasnella sp. 419]|nr:hypothetical protein FRC03_000863 [Tulasnella sp. 419]
MTDSFSGLVWHPQLSFDDGNIVLRVKAASPFGLNGSMDESEVQGSDNKEATHLHFRIHRSVLADHSEVFATMFNIPQPEQQSTDGLLIDGCDFIDMHDDCADLEKLLKVLYGYAPPYKRLHQSSLDYYEPVLVLAKKYAITQVIETYLPRVTDGWPTSLEEWELFETEINLITQKLQSQPTENNQDGDMIVQPSSVIRLSRHFENELLSILPSVYIHFSRLSPEMQNNTPECIASAKKGSFSANRNILLGQEFTKLLDGQWRISSYILSLAHTPNCVLDWPSSCNHVRYSTRCNSLGWWQTQLGEHFISNMRWIQGDILKTLKNVFRTFSDRPRESGPIYICDVCHSHISSQLGYEGHKIRKQTWTRIRGFFGINDISQT